MNDAARIFDEHAASYAQKFGDVSAYAPALEELAKALPQGAQVLDVGCGPGNLAQWMLARRPDLRWLGIDLAPAMVQIATAALPQARFEQLDVRDLHQLQEPFNALVLSFCLPYLNEAEATELFSQCRRLLKPGGHLYISTMVEEVNLSKLETNSHGQQLLMHYYSEGWILWQLAGLELVFEMMVGDDWVGVMRVAAS